MAADKLYLAIMLRKEVETVEQGRALLDVVKAKLEDQPTVEVSGGVSVKFIDDPE